MSEASITTLKKQIKSGKVETDKETIRKYLQHTDGMTSLDLEQTLGMIHQTFSGRLSELVTNGEVYYAGTVKNECSASSILRYEHDIMAQFQRQENIEFHRYRKLLRKVKEHRFCSVEFEKLIDKELGN